MNQAAGTSSGAGASSTQRETRPWMDRPDIQKDLFTRNLMTTKLFIGPLFKAPNPAGLSPTRYQKCEMALLLIYAKGHVHKMAGEDEIKLGLMMELMARYVSDVDIMSDKDATERIIDRTKVLLVTKLGIWSAGASITVAAQNHPLPLAQDHQVVANVKTLNEAIIVLNLLRDLLLPKYKAWPKMTLIEYYCAMSTRGNMTDAKISRLTENINEQTGTDIDHSRDRIRRYYTSAGRYITENNVREIFTEWTKNISEEALSLKLIISQAQYGGLTQLMTIGRAMIDFGDFNWKLLENFFPGELLRWENAMNSINGNVYYGYCHNLGAAAPRNYINLAYACKELLIRSGGNDSLKRYVGWASSCKSHAKVIALIEAYLESKTGFDPAHIISTSEHRAVKAAKKWTTMIMGQVEDLVAPTAKRPRPASQSETGEPPLQTARLDPGSGVTEDATMDTQDLSDSSDEEVVS